MLALPLCRAGMRNHCDLPSRHLISTAKILTRTSAQATRICSARITKVNRFLLKSKTGDIKNTMSNIEFAATAVIEEINNSLNYTKESVPI